MTAPLTPSQTRQILQEQGHLPQKALGQNFLIDPNLVRKSLELGQIKAGDVVVEVGPGLGTLSLALLKEGVVLYAVEKDPRLVRYLRESVVPQWTETFHLLEGDALKHPRAECPADDFKVVANLPYAISTPWMEKILEDPIPSRLVLMLQKEAADRFVATPNSKLFGPISILLDLTYRRAPGHAVSRHCFYPQPDVDSVLLVLERLPEPRLLCGEARGILRKLFGQRRKQALPRLKREFKDSELGGQAVTRWAEMGLDPLARPEQIGADSWWKLLGESA